MTLNKGQILMFVFVSSHFQRLKNQQKCARKSQHHCLNKPKLFRKKNDETCLLLITRLGNHSYNFVGFSMLFDKRCQPK